MSAENRLREAAIAAEDAAAEMYSRGTIGASEHHEVIALAKIAEVMHALADRRDAADFTESTPPVPELRLGGLQLKHLQLVIEHALNSFAFDQRTQDLLDLVREVRR